MSTTPRQKSAWRARTRLKRKGKAYVDPLVGMGSKSFLKQQRELEAKRLWASLSQRNPDRVKAIKRLRFLSAI